MYDRPPGLSGSFRSHRPVDRDRTPKHPRNRAKQEKAGEGFTSPAFTV